jgi:hypothetical protein
LTGRIQALRLIISPLDTKGFSRIGVISKPNIATRRNIMCDSPPLCAAEMRLLCVARFAVNDPIFAKVAADR